MNPSDPKKPSGNPDEEPPRPDESGPGQRHDDETPTDHPELADEPKRGIDPPTNPPKIDEPTNPASKPQGTTQDQIENMESEGPGPAGRTDNEAGG